MNETSQKRIENIFIRAKELQVNFAMLTPETPAFVFFDNEANTGVLGLGTAEKFLDQIEAMVDEEKGGAA